MTEWYFIKDKQPEKYERVLVWFPKKSEPGNWIEIGVWNGEILISDNFASSVNAWFEGTHWTYLPELPNKQNIKFKDKEKENEI